MPRQFETEAKILVDQHYAAGPERMKEVIADALRHAVRSRTGQGASTCWKPLPPLDSFHSRV